ncbi:MAG: hypothetical protein GY847_31760 [Proteobacteria bacterium]|nr:hypothetical protein [Pseudomonadota bacterium]
MHRLLFAIMILFYAQNVLADEPSDMEDRIVAPVARKVLEKKYASIEANLKTKAKTRISVVSTNFYKLVRKSRKESDFYTMAEVETRKLFGLATPKQFKILVFYTLMSTLNRVETEIDELLKNYADTSIMFSILNIKALLLIESGTMVFSDIKRTNSRTARNIL